MSAAKSGIFFFSARYINPHPSSSSIKGPIISVASAKLKLLPSPNQPKIVLRCGYDKIGSSRRFARVCSTPVLSFEAKNRAELK